MKRTEPNEYIDRHFDAEEYVYLFYQDHRWPWWLYLVIGLVFGAVIWAFTPAVCIWIWGTPRILDFWLAEIIGVFIVVFLVAANEQIGWS